VVARDSTVRSRKRVPVINEEQRLEVVKLLKPVDEAYLGSTTDMFEIVKKINPDIITIGSDQNFDLERLQKELGKRNLKAEVVKITGYRKSSLDSSCKIIRKIKETEFQEDALKNC
jgi:FAD synthetase